MNILGSALLWQSATVLAGASLWWVKHESDYEIRLLKEELSEPRSDWNRVQFYHPITHQISWGVRERILEATYAVTHPGCGPRIDFISQYAMATPADVAMVGSDQDFLDFLLREVEDIGNEMHAMRKTVSRAAAAKQSPPRASFVQRIMSGDGN